VCTGLTGFREAARVEYDADTLPLRQLLFVFFAAVDPTQYHRQGPDVGSQYQSGVYWTDPADEPAIRAVAAGERVFSPEIKHALALESEPPILSMRQLEVLNLTAKGFTNKEIGDFLGIGVNGVKAHLKQINARLGATSRTEATTIAINLRLISG
jgi:DNA-binding CsgD family transcriptional regulator